MRQHAFASRIVASRETGLRALEEQLATSRLEEMNGSRRRHGITRELGYLQEDPHRPSLFVLYQEGDDVDSAFERLIRSSHPFDRWLTGRLFEVLDLPNDQTPRARSELVLDTWALGLPGDLHLFAAPIASDQLGGWLRFTSELNGARHRDYEESRRRIGYGERVFLQRTPEQAYVIPCIRGSEPELDIELLSASQHPFEVWFTGEISKYHGIDFAKPLPWESQRLRAWGVDTPVTA